MASCICCRTISLVDKKGSREAAEKAATGIQFETESKLGDVVEEIEDTCTNKEVVALVVGTKEMSGLERFLLGNTAISIIKSCSSPVLTVPQGAPIKAPRKIALAVDNSEGLPVEKIANLLQLFNADLHVVHVETENETSRVRRNTVACLTTRVVL